MTIFFPEILRQRIETLCTLCALPVHFFQSFAAWDIHLAIPPCFSLFLFFSIYVFKYYTSNCFKIQSIPFAIRRSGSEK